MKTLAEEVFVERPNIQSEDELFSIGFERLRAKDGLRSARYYFWFHEDFASDFVSEYFWLQRNQKGV